MKTTKLNYYELAVDYFNQHEFSLAKECAQKQLDKDPRDINALKLLAFVEYQSSNFSQSLHYLEQITDIDENIAEINNLIGCAYLKTGDYPQCINYFTKCIENDNQYLDAYTNLTQALQQSNQSEQAYQVCKIALTISPDSTAILDQCADLAFDLNDINNAQNLYDSSLSLDPLSLHANIGIAKCALENDNEEAVVQQLKALKQGSDQAAPIRLDVTNQLLQYGKTQSAITSYFELVDDTEQKESIFNNIASAYDHLNNIDEAIQFFLKALSENNNYVPAHLNIGRIYTDTGELESAEKHLSKALELEPENINALINTGRLYEVKNNTRQAKRHFEKALSIEPNNAMAHCNLGNSYQQMGDFESAYHSYKTSLKNDPTYADAELNLGINELVTGKFDTAWGHYFKRIRNLSQGEQLSTITPGMSLSGKHVYFCRSQGIGDELFFLRFLPTLKQQGITITYRPSEKSYNLFLQIPEIDHLIHEDGDIPACDYYFTIDDIPLILNINHVSKIVPPLPLTPSTASLKKAQKSLKRYPAPYTAITWRAGTQTTQINYRDNQRNLSKELSLDTIKKIISPMKGSIIILQRNPETDEIRQLNNMFDQPIIDLSQWNESLEDMLALLSVIDDYIGVSNTNMHLLAALGKTADVLIPFPPDWRWMIEGKESPWFPGFRIYREDINHNWKTAVDELTQRLSTPHED